METRRCADCEEEKTVRAVWFLVSRSEGGNRGFLCGECYSGQQEGLRGASVQRETREPAG